MLNALDTMKIRRSIREFETTLVPLDTITKIVEAAGCSASSKNTQPWRLFLVQGAALEALRADYLTAFDASVPGKAAYTYSPNPLPEAWSIRARDCGISLFKHKGIGRDDKEKRVAHDRSNFEFFGAQQIFFVGISSNTYSYGTFLDIGLMFGSLMTGLAAEGLGSCPQFSVMAYPDLLKKHLPGSADVTFVAGLPFGIPKKDSLVNGFQTPRMPVSEWFSVVE